MIFYVWSEDYFIMSIGKREEAYKQQLKYQ